MSEIKDYSSLVQNEIACAEAYFERAKRYMKLQETINAIKDALREVLQ